MSEFSHSCNGVRIGDGSLPFAFPAASPEWPPAGAPSSSFAASLS